MFLPRHRLGSIIRRAFSTTTQSHAAQLFNLIFLGSGGGNPTAYRASSSILLNLGGEGWIFECADGSVRQLLQSKSTCDVNKIFISHLHPDHIGGLPAMVMHAVNVGQKSVPLEIFGPPGTYTYLCTALSISHSQLPREVIVRELKLSDTTCKFMTYKNSWKRFAHPKVDLRIRNLFHSYISPNEEFWDVFDNKRFYVQAGLLRHTVPCFGFVLTEIPKAGKLDVDKLDKLGIPRQLYNDIKCGKDVILDNGTIIRSKDYVGESFPGRKICILGDCENAFNLEPIAKNCDLLVHEASLCDERLSEAVGKGHSAPSLAAEAARVFNAKRLVLNHIGPRYAPHDDLSLSSDLSMHDLVSDKILENQAAASLGRPKHVLVARDFTMIEVPSGGYEIKQKQFLVTERIHRKTKNEKSFNSAFHEITDTVQS